MKKNTERIHAKINLEAISENAKMLRSCTGNDAHVMAVIKSDAYGHGATKIAHALDNMDYVWGFAVATGSEALALKYNGIKKPILLLGAAFPDELETLIDNEIRLCLYSRESAALILEGADNIGKKAYIHLKLDTGMGRIGFSPTDNDIDELYEILSNPLIITEGAFTHFSKADTVDRAYSKKQTDLFFDMVNELSKRGIDFQYKHLANSAGIVEFNGATGDLIRAGISLYGLYPSGNVNQNKISLKPALSLYSRVIHVKDIDKDTMLSYGGTFISEKKMRVATVSAGYGDGYPRALSNIGYVLIHGKRANILGRICMDQMIVDVTHIDNVVFGDSVTLIGKDIDNEITIDELCALYNGFNYEFVCNLNKRVPRIYV